MITLGTVFTGIGAIEQALERLGIEHEIVFACDNGDIDINIDVEKEKEILSQMTTCIEKKRYVDMLYASKSRKQNHVKKTYLANYNINEDNFHLDIRLFDGCDYHGQVDLLVGGSPCQSFSSVGYKGGLEDARGTLFYDYARIIQEVQPKVFIYENVRGLTTHDQGRTWQKMKAIFSEDLHYTVTEPQILNAADYGIPQNRRRVFVIGIRQDIQALPFEYPQPVELKYTMQDFLEDNCKDGDFTFDRATGDLIVGKSKGNPDPKFTLTPKVRDYVLAGGTKNFRTSTKTDLPIARTILKTMTQHHRAGVDNYITVSKKGDDITLRSLTDRETLRLMGYPDNFKMVVSSAQIFRQAGNSIVVDVMMAIVKQILKTRALD